MSGQRAQQEAEVRRHSPARGLCCDVDSDSVFPQWDLWDLSALQTQSHSIGAAGNRSISSGCNETADADVQNPSSFFCRRALDGWIHKLPQETGDLESGGGDLAENNHGLLVSITNSASDLLSLFQFSYLFDSYLMSKSHTTPVPFPFLLWIQVRNRSLLLLPMMTTMIMMMMMCSRIQENQFLSSNPWVS